MQKRYSTLFEKIWRTHNVRQLPGGDSLLFVDRVVLHEITAPGCFQTLGEKNLRTRKPEFAISTVDHIVSSRPDRTAHSFAPAIGFVEAMRNGAEEHGIRFIDLDDPRHGIVHVMASEQGFVMPGMVAVCGDSHTCTLGALGALAFGIGTTDIAHVLATQSLRFQKPKQMRVWVEGALAPGVFAKDLILHIIGAIGAKGGIGYAVEFAGPVIEALSIEERMTVCNMSIEFSARIGLVAPDEKTVAFVEGRPMAPKGQEWEQAKLYWAKLRTDPAATFDKEITIDASKVAPMVTWGTSPEDAIPVDCVVPDLEGFDDAVVRESKTRALNYMGLAPGDKLSGLPVDMVFIGSCTNGYLPDLRSAAKFVAGRKVVEGLRAIVAPGSAQVRKMAEKEGLDKVFREAGFEWHQAGCSLCCSLGPDTVEGGKRIVSTSNRNFENRQGPTARTHLASPAMAAVAAVTGKITDIRFFEGGL